MRLWCCACADYVSPRLPKRPEMRTAPGKELRGIYMRVNTGQPIFQKTASARGTTLEARYYYWLHSWETCCLSGRPDIEVAHTGGYAQGKSMSRKAALETCLPIASALHRAEERDRVGFWEGVGLPDYLDWAQRLFDIFEANGDPRPLFADMQALADRGFMMGILRR